MNDRPGRYSLNFHNFYMMLAQRMEHCVMNQSRKSYLIILIMLLVVVFGFSCQTGNTASETAKEDESENPSDDPRNFAPVPDVMPDFDLPDLSLLPIESWKLPKADVKRDKPLVLFIGFDGTTWKVIAPLMKRGKLANFQKLCGAGSFGYLNTDVGLSPVSWTSIMTGMAKEDHGIYGEKVWERIFEKRVFHIWDILAKNGWKIGITYFPYLHEKYVPDGAFYFEANRQVPDDLLEGFSKENDDEFAFEEFLTVQQVFLIREKSYDAAFGYFDYTDVVSHQSYNQFVVDEVFQKDVKSSSPFVQRYIRENADRERTAYAFADKVVGMMLELRPDYVFIMSDHGFATSGFEFTSLFNTKFLHEVGLDGQNPEMQRLWLEFGYQNEDFRFSFDKDKSPKVENKNLLQKFHLMDLKNGKMPLEANLNTAGVTIDYGTDKPPAGFFEFLDHARKVKVDGMPFLSVQEKDGKYMFKLSSQVAVQVVKGKRDIEFLDFSEYDANHGPNDPGIMIMAGNGIKKGHLLHGAGLHDLVPTLLYLLDLPVAKDFAGKVLTDGISEAHLAKHPIKFIDTYGRPTVDTQQQKVLSDQEKKKLKELGYLK